MNMNDVRSPAEIADSLSKEGVLALRKCESAERFVLTPGKVRIQVFLNFIEEGLIEWRNGHRLTALGRAVLAAVDRETK